MNLEFKALKTLTPVVGLAFAIGVMAPARADPGHVGGSSNVAVVPSPFIAFGGVLPTAGGAFNNFTFTNLAAANVNAANLAPYDTVVLNMTGPGLSCNSANLSASQKADLNAFVSAGGKLIIYDSECTFGGSVDYSWLTYPFSTTNPGAAGFIGGVLTIVEDNTLSHNMVGNPHYIDANAIVTQTDAVGDMNVVDLTTVDAAWCLDLTGTNVNNVTGAVHMYAQSGLGLYIYNGLDADFIANAVGPSGGGQLAKLWLQELEAGPSASELPCLVAVIGITMSQQNDVNDVGQDHTVTATLLDITGDPQPGIVVNFMVVSGPNTGAAGSCSANADCSTDANGQVSFTYTGLGGVGIDEIMACFVNEAGETICSDVILKEWVAPPATLDIKPGSCPNPLNTGSNGVIPVGLLGSDTFDVTLVDLSSLQISRADGVGGSVGPHEGPPGPHTTLSDVGTPFDGVLCDCHELEGDGILDVNMKFKTQEVVDALQLKDVPDGTFIELCVSGTLMDGTQFSACDCMRIKVHSNNGQGHAVAVNSNIPGAWIGVTPMDDYVDGGGFTEGQFTRHYSDPSVLSLTHEPIHEGFIFGGWMVNGQVMPSTWKGKLTVNGHVTVTAIWTFPFDEPVVPTKDPRKGGFGDG